MPLSLHQLEVFANVARHGTTRAAAESVSRSQSAASMALAELEAQFGVPLFDRPGRRLVLNENGRILLPQALALLEHAAEVERAFASEAAVSIRLAASTTIGNYLLPDAITSFRRAVPGAILRLRIGNTQEVADAVAGFDVDVGFVEGSIHHQDLIVTPWGRDELVACAAPDHPLAGRRASARALREAVWVMREPGSGTREVVDQWLREHLGPVEPALELGSSEAIIRAVVRGAGVCCLSRHALGAALAARQVVELRTTLPPLMRQLTMVTHRAKRLAAGTGRFLEHCRASGA